MRRHWNPAGVTPPYGRYSQAVLVDARSRLLVVSGLLGTRADGTVPAALEEQVLLIFAGIDQALTDAGLRRQDLIRLTTFLTSIEGREPFMRVRDAWVVDPPPASTLVIVKALVRPDCLVEIEATAAA